MIVPSVDKLAKAGEKYQFSLPEKYRKTALDELHESEEIRDQSLAQLRDWIAKNPAIHRCRTDAVFLLRFLRTRKFNHIAACENLERYLAMNQNFPRWFQKLDTTESWVQEMIDDWPLLPLGCDAQGRVVFLIKFSNFNVERFKNTHQIRLMMMILATLWEEEALQVAGGIFIFEDTGLTMSHLAQWSITDIKSFINCVNHSLPLRIKEIHAVNLPRYAVTVADLCLSFASAKLKQRVQCHRTMDDLAKVMDLALLPKEFGGTRTVKDLKQDLRERLTKYRDLILAQDQMEVDLSRYAALWKENEGSGLEDGTGVVGSFRKLNVD
ncbi:retinaldehyde-binding protein 1-like [Uranotaenia lowii]|uniref:retinaldehyde-binding protein 1-like n=1 Tax=Uranotaenia lowii TaxID=190385 RepID=UPI00247A069B|nr:retinaldehyde-binding protein 1-like [Uranotaenia lowii]